MVKKRGFEIAVQQFTSRSGLKQHASLIIRTIRLVFTSDGAGVGFGSRSGRINQSESTFPRFVISLGFPLLLPTPTIWFSLDHKRNVSDGVVRGIGMLFSLDHKRYASDSDSLASENQP